MNRVEANVVICGALDDDVYRRLGKIKGLNVLRDWLPSTSDKVPSIVLSMHLNESFRVEHITPRMLLIARLVSNVIFVNLKWYTDVIMSNSLCPITTYHLNEQMIRIQTRQSMFSKIAPLQNYIYTWINDEEPVFRDFMYSLMIPMDSLNQPNWYSISSIDLSTHPKYDKIKCNTKTTYILSNVHGFIECPKTNIRFNLFEDYFELPLGKINRVTRFDEICSEFISGFMFKPFEKISIQRRMIDQQVALTKIPMSKRKTPTLQNQDQKKQKIEQVIERDLVDPDGMIRFEFTPNELFDQTEILDSDFSYLFN